jgi:RNA-binding protein
MPAALSEKQKRQLRTLGHKLHPLVIIGHAGFTEAVFKEIDGALTYHELIKVRVNASDREARQAMIDQILERSQAALAQKIGHIILIYRRNPEKQRIKLTAP